jgi:undecaprenyl-diphosphatase
VALLLVLFLGLLQGATELFPVSSLGHAVVVPALLHLGFKQSDDNFVPLLVLLHLGTAGALLIIYWRDWQRITTGFVRAALRGRVDDADERLAVLIVIATVPAGLIGFLFEKQFKSLFATPVPASAFLCVNAAILLAAEALRRRDERRHAAEVDPHDREEMESRYARVEGLSTRSALIVGTSQALALFPGISRAGITLAVGLGAGLRHEEALRFSFLLATPIILAAGVLEVPQLFTSGVPLGSYFAGAVLAGLAAYASARFLIRYFHVGRLDPFAAYCLGLGVLGLAFTR